MEDRAGNLLIMANVEEKKEYDLIEDGFCILKGVFPIEDLYILHERSEEIIKTAEQRDSYSWDPFEKYYLEHRVDQGVLYDLYQRVPEFRKIAESPTILKALEPVLGGNVFLYENSLVYKPRNKSNEVPWHQDFMNRSEEPIKYISWTALDKVRVENGALKVLPGSHKKGFLPWYKAEGETHHTRLITEGLNLENFVFAELDPGDVLIFNQLLVHGSNRVDSLEKRRAYRVSYQNFQEIYTPRGTPIVLSLKKPLELLQRKTEPIIEDKHIAAKQPFYQKVKRKIKGIIFRVLQIK